MSRGNHNYETIKLEVMKASAKKQKNNNRIHGI